MPRTFLAGLIPSTLYLWFADRTAIKLGIWTIAPETSFGLSFFGLPIEEAVFFLMTNLLVVQGVPGLKAVGLVAWGSTNGFTLTASPAKQQKKVRGALGLSRDLDVVVAHSVDETPMCGPWCPYAQAPKSIVIRSSSRA